MAAITITSTGDCSTCCGGCAACACNDPTKACINCPCDTPSALTVSFVGGSMQTACLDCLDPFGTHVSYKVLAGTLAGLTFVVTNDAAGPCRYTFNTGAGGPITVAAYTGWGCPGAPAGMSDVLDLSVTWLGGGSVGIFVRIGGTWVLFDTLQALPGIGDCCVTGTSTDPATSGDCTAPTAPRMAWGATAIITPCP
jgi:hypothetical protein